MACGNKSIDCSNDTRSSVVVTLESETGIDAPIVSYSVAEAEYQTADPYADNQWIAGWEESGTITLLAEANICPDNPDCICLAQQQIDVLVPRTDDDCHVITQEVTMTFTEADIIDTACLTEEDSGS